jgi:flagellar biosynthesis/type III secretory pathway M-ring protein FliF/YscJ
MEDNRYKSCAIAIVIILLIVLAILVLPMILTSCRAHSVASQEVTQQHSVQTVTDSASETASRVHWLSDLNLDLDSFEMVILPYPGALGMADSCTVLDQSSSQPPRQAGAVVLRAKHATLGKSDYVERNASRSTQQHTASSDTSSLIAQENKTIDMTGIAKPPNMDWVLPLAIITAAAVLLAIGYFKCLKK